MCDAGIRFEWIFQKMLRMGQGNRDWIWCHSGFRGNLTLWSSKDQRPSAYYVIQPCITTLYYRCKLESHLFKGELLGGGPHPPTAFPVSFCFILDAETLWAAGKGSPHLLVLLVSHRPQKTILTKITSWDRTQCWVESISGGAIAALQPSRAH